MTDEDFENLVQSYRLVAAHLEVKGWLDKAYILVDESSRASLQMLRRYCETLKRDPLTARLRICFTIDKLHPFTEPDPTNPDQGLLQDMIDIWTPENNEEFNSIRSAPPSAASIASSTEPQQTSIKISDNVFSIIYSPLDLGPRYRILDARLEPESGIEYIF